MEVIQALEPWHCFSGVKAENKIRNIKINIPLSRKFGRNIFILCGKIWGIRELRNYKKFRQYLSKMMNDRYNVIIFGRYVKSQKSKGEKMDNKRLILEAEEARKHAYAPYSHFLVGAALLTKSGKIYHGCNIENASYTPTNCAERTAFFKAIYEGEREFEKIAIVGGMEGTGGNDICAPCGVCRQVMMEFCNPKKFKIILKDGEECYREYRLEELFPLGFGPENLK